MSGLAKKLGIRSGMHLLIEDPPPGYLELLTPLPADVSVSSRRDVTYSGAPGTWPFVQFFCTTLAGLNQSVPELLRLADPGALVWIGYPKKTSGIKSDLNRDVVCEAFAGTGWRPVSIIAINDVWSALRFRPEADVKKKAAASRR